MSDSHKILFADHFVNSGLTQQERLVSETFRNTIQNHYQDDAVLFDIADDVSPRESPDNDDTFRGSAFRTIRNDRLSTTPQVIKKVSMLEFLMPNPIPQQPQILGLFTVRDILKLQLASKTFFYLLSEQNAIKKLIRMGNLEPELRLPFWKYLIFTKNGAKLEDYPAYEECLTMEIPEKVRDEISRDLNRTNTTALIKTEVGQSQMKRVLEAIAAAVPEVGYCQGMNFIACILIEHCRSEEIAYFVFMEMLHKMEMKCLYLPGVPELHLKNFQFGQLIKHYLPTLQLHFRSIQLSPDYFTSKWIMTLFSCFLPEQYLGAIFDVFLMDGWAGVMRVGIAFLKQIEEKLKDMDMVETSNYFRDNVRCFGSVDSFTLMATASVIRVSSSTIHSKEVDKLREQFHIIQAEAKLKQSSDEWDADQTEALKQAKQTLDKMDPHTKEDINKFQDKLAKIDKDMDRHSKIVLAATIDFQGIRDEYTQVSDKLSVLEQTHEHLDENLKNRRQGKQWKLVGKFNLITSSKSKSNIASEFNLQNQLQSDVTEIQNKIEILQSQLAILTPEYKEKKQRYRESKLKMDELKGYKKKVQQQMNGFIIMYEVKKEETMKDLSKKLQQSERYLKDHSFS